MTLMGMGIRPTASSPDADSAPADSSPLLLAAAVMLSAISVMCCTGNNSTIDCELAVICCIRLQGMMLHM